MTDDWKDKLGAAMGWMLDDATGDDTHTASTDANPADNTVTAAQMQGGAPLHIIYERKGRAGKQVTIVADFVVPDDVLRDVAHRLKVACGVGGSARGGEILIQGDHRDRVRTLLKEMGFKVKG